MELTTEQAIKNLKIVLAEYKGTKEEHYWLDLSIKLIEKKCSIAQKVEI